MKTQDCESQGHPGQRMFETCKRCKGEVYPWSGHTDPTPWILRNCDHVAWPERRRGTWDELIEDPCWSDRENSLDRAPRLEFWGLRGQKWHQKTYGD